MMDGLPPQRFCGKRPVVQNPLLDKEESTVSAITGVVSFS